MQSELNVHHYQSAEVFAQEQERIFRKLWIFACMLSAVAVPEAFATRTIGGVSLLIQNCEGTIRAFENACPHRLMPIQSDEFGQSRMVCPYHGWVFDARGAVKTIPKEQTLYAYTPAERERLCLKEFHVQVIGQLVFIHLDDQPLPIEAQFSADLIDQLRAISSHFGSQAVHANIDTRYNWKLNYENVLDHNHIPYIHPKSFLPLMKKDAAQAAPTNQEVTLPDDLITGALQAQSHMTTTSLNIEAWPWHQQVRRYGQADTYYNFFLFPNVNFISVGGVIFLVQQFDPISAAQTQVRFTLCAAQETSRIPALPAILRGHLKGEIDVLHEDVAHLERLQAHLHSGSPRVQHGRYEHRLMSFAKAYRRLMEGTPV